MQRALIIGGIGVAFLGQNNPVGIVFAALLWGILARGREQESVNLVELPLQERAPVLREFPNSVPHGVRFFRQLYGISGTPEEFEALASRCPVFRVEEARP